MRILTALPPGLKVVAADRHGVSAWSTTALITTKAEDDTIIRFFVKYAAGEHGEKQLNGEFHAMREISQVAADLAPKPYAFGILKNQSLPTFFFLSEFAYINNDLPEPQALGASLAKLHRESRSPTGQFGLHTTTYDGKLPQKTDWESSWTVFFGNLLTATASLDSEINGPWDDLSIAIDQTVKIVIPRLLDALEAEGRGIKPCLIHGDLWEGNIGTDYQTGKLYIFDAASYYTHNEMELGIWRTDHHQMKSKAYKVEYLRNFEASEPVDEWDDRNRLYSVKTQLMYSAHVPGSKVRNE